MKQLKGLKVSRIALLIMTDPSLAIYKPLNILKL